MTEQTLTNVLAAYQMLLEELDAEIVRVNEAGSRAFAGGEHARAQELLATAETLTGLRGDLVAWGRRAQPLVGTPAPKAPRRHLQHGLQTPKEKYREPILRALVEMGGTGTTGEVLDRVYALMKDQLNEHDLAPLRSNKRLPRWRSTATWGRNMLREQGLIESGSPRGVWEISEQGRQWLREQE